MKNSHGSICAAISATSATSDQVAPIAASLIGSHRVNGFGKSGPELAVPIAGVSSPFVDPALSAPDAPICWLPETGAGFLDARSARPSRRVPADLALGNLRCVRHVVIGPGNVEHVLIRTTDRAVTLRLNGHPASQAPVHVTFLVPGLSKAREAGNILAAFPDLVSREPRWPKRTRRQSLMRDALIALDGHSAGATYREIAAVIVGTEFARAAWSSSSRALKDRMRRALGKGRQLRDGGYRRLLD